MLVCVIKVFQDFSFSLSLSLVGNLAITDLLGLFLQQNSRTITRGVVASLALGFA